MTILEALISGVVQGITEFLPVSSSGHLVLVHSIFGFKEPSIFFDICLHAATLAAVIMYFGDDIRAIIRTKDFKWVLYLTIGTVPAVLVGYFFEDKISAIFRDPGTVSLMLIVTGLVLFAGQFAQSRRQTISTDLTLRASLMVGLAQACALIPGISRSGMTVSAGLAGGMKTETAFRFSFLLSVPIIIGATIYKVLTMDNYAVVPDNLAVYIIGMASAFIVGLLALRFLWWVLKNKSLYIFAVYCLAAGTVGLMFWR